MLPGAALGCAPGGKPRRLCCTNVAVAEENRAERDAALREYAPPSRRTMKICRSTCAKLSQEAPATMALEAGAARRVGRAAPAFDGGGSGTIDAC
jgi:hypothetical protein